MFMALKSCGEDTPARTRGCTHARGKRGRLVTVDEADVHGSGGVRALRHRASKMQKRQPCCTPHVNVLPVPLSSLSNVSCAVECFVSLVSFVSFPLGSVNSSQACHSMMEMAQRGEQWDLELNTRVVDVWQDRENSE